MAVNFNATGESYVATLNLGAPATNLTVSCWIKVNVNRATTTMPWSFYGASGVEPLRANLWNGVDLTIQTDEWFILAGLAPTVGTWYYIGFSADSAGPMVSCFRAAGSTTVGGGPTNLGATTFHGTTLRIGSGFNTANDWLNGSMAAVKVWNRSLTFEQLEAESYTYQPKNTTNLVAWYPLTSLLTADFSGGAKTLSGGSGASLEDGPPLAWSSGLPTVFRVAGPTLKDLADSGSATDSLSVNALTSLEDFGSATESFSVVRTIPIADTGSGNDSLAVNNALSLSDSGTISESFSTQVSVTLSDSGSSLETLSVVSKQIPLGDVALGVEALATSVSLPLAETASATDSLTKSVATPLSDSGTSTEAISKSVATSLVESGTSSESLLVAASVPLSDSGTATESFSQGMPVSLSDSGSSYESLAANSVTSFADFASSSESLLVVVTTTLTDSGSSADSLVSSSGGNLLTESASAVESLTVSVTTALHDLGNSSESVTVGALIALGDVANGSESLSVGTLKPLGDQGSATDALSVTVALRLADVGSAVELLTTDGTRVLSDFATATDLLHVFNHSQVIPGHMTVGEINTPRMVSVRTLLPTVEGQERSSTEMKSGEHIGSRMEGD